MSSTSGRAVGVSLSLALFVLTVLVGAVALGLLSQTSEPRRRQPCPHRCWRYAPPGPATSTTFGITQGHAKITLGSGCYVT